MIDFPTASEALSHTQRIRLARENAPILSAPEDGFFLRQYSLFSKTSSRDEKNVAETALHDKSERLRCRALKALARFCCDETALSTLSKLEPRLEMLFLRELQSQQRQTVIDRHLQTSATPRVETLAYASPELLNSHLERLLDQATSDDWSRLTRRHPQWVLRNFLQSEIDGHASLRAHVVILALCKMRSQLAWPAWQAAAEAEIVLSHSLEDQVFSICYKAMTTWALQTVPEESGFVRHQVPRWNFSSRVRRMDEDMVEALLKRGWIKLNLHWWKRLSPERRLRTWELGKDALTWPTGAIPPIWLRGLPLAERLNLARQQKNLGAVQMEPAHLCPYLAMLGWEDGYKGLRPYMESPEPSDRAAALSSFVKLAFYQVESMGAVLEELGHRRNEPDPVRGAFLTSLSEIAGGRIQTEHLPRLDEILHHLLSASDASFSSFGAAEKLVLGQFTTHSDWAGDWLVRLLRHQGTAVTSEWERALEPPGVAEIVDRVSCEVLNEWEPQERHFAVFGLTDRVNHHLSRMPLLQKRLIRMCDHALADVASDAFSRLLRNAPKQLAELLPKLVQNDLSWVSRNGVANWLHRHRQDLLTPVLRDEVVEGKFASGRTKWVLSLEKGFWRWTPSQQRAYSVTLDKMLQNEERDFWTHRSNLRALAQLPDIEPTVLIRSAQLSEARQAIRDEALRCLGRVEEGKGVRPLLEALDDERSRVAIYAVRQQILRMQVDEALKVLRSVTSRKVTVRKELARLLGDLPNRAGLPTLLERLQSETHRDVQIATYRGLWSHIEQDSAWQVLSLATELPDEAVGRSLVQISNRGLTALGRSRVENILLKLLTHPSRRVRFAVLQRLHISPIHEPSDSLFTACLEMLDSEPESSTAASALLATCRRRPERWEALLAESMPEKKKILRLVTALRISASYVMTRDLYLPVVDATLEQLAKEPAFTILRLELIASTQRTERLLTEFQESWTNGLASSALPFAWKGLLQAHGYRLDRSTYQAIASRWKSCEEDMLKRLALESLLEHAQQYGWSDENRAELENYQNDDSLLVKLGAQFVFPPPK